MESSARGGLGGTRSLAPLRKSASPRWKRLCATSAIPVRAAAKRRKFGLHFGPAPPILTPFGTGGVLSMAPRANWKGFLRLSLVTCPIALFPAASESEKISFNQINKKTGHRIRYLKVDAETGEEVSNEDIIKGYQIDKDRYLEVTKDELENIAPESTRTIEIDEFVPRTEINDLYLARPYYIVPDGKVGHDAFAVIRETIARSTRLRLPASS